MGWGKLISLIFDNIVVFRYVQDFYEVDKLGEGGFGSVFRARNRLDDRMYAIKKMNCLNCIVNKISN